MSAVALAVDAVAPAHAEQAPARVALLGTGTVGRALSTRLASWAGTPLGARLSLVHVANSRHAVSSRFGIAADATEVLLAHHSYPSTLGAVVPALAGDGARIVIDATASEEVAAQHAQWLAQGIHVVTACKLGQGTALARWRQIRASCRDGMKFRLIMPPPRCHRSLGAGLAA